MGRGGGRKEEAQRREGAQDKAFKTVHVVLLKG